MKGSESVTVVRTGVAALLVDGTGVDDDEDEVIVLDEVDVGSGVGAGTGDPVAVVRTSVVALLVDETGAENDDDVDDDVDGAVERVSVCRHARSHAARTLAAASGIKPRTITYVSLNSRTNLPVTASAASTRLLPSTARSTCECSASERRSTGVSQCVVAAAAIALTYDNGSLPVRG